MGHFDLRCDDARPWAVEPPEVPVGLGYSFSLAGGATCAEFAVSPRYLAELLASAGFDPALSTGQPADGDHGGAFSVPAQLFLAAHGAAHESLQRIMKDRRCSATDWRTMAFFRVVLARKKPLPAPLPAAPDAPPEGAFSRHPPRSRRREPRLPAPHPPLPS
jgi:hypothetical protein